MENDTLYEELAILFARRAQMPPRELYATNAAEMFDSAIAKRLPRAAQKCIDRFTPDSYDSRNFHIECVREMALEAQLRLAETPDDAQRQKLFAPIIAALQSDAVKAQPDNVMVLAQALLESYARRAAAPSPAPAVR